MPRPLRARFLWEPRGFLWEAGAFVTTGGGFETLSLPPFARSAVPRPLLVLLLVPLWAGCARPSGEGMLSEAALADLPDQESWDAVLQLSEAGVPRVILRAPYLARYDRPDSTVVRLGPDTAGDDTARVRVEIYDEAGAPTATLTADRLDYLERQREFVAKGGVVVTTGAERRLESERVVWNEVTRSLRADGLFRFTSPTERIQGYGLRANEDLSRYTFTRARGELEVEE